VSKLRSGNASLSQLLYEDRPFLWFITFLRPKATPNLLLGDEELFKPVAEEAGPSIFLCSRRLCVDIFVGEASHVPSAERVYQIHGTNSGS
jgi:hypothetical protein